MNQVIGRLHSFQGGRESLRVEQIGVKYAGITLERDGRTKAFALAHETSDGEALLIKTVKKAAADKAGGAGEKYRTFLHCSPQPLSVIIIPLRTADCRLCRREGILQGEGVLL
jgi:hypothetical protein